MANDFSNYATWPEYPGYSPWSLTSPEDVPGSDDHRIRSELLPTNRFATRYNPFVTDLPLDEFVGFIIPLPGYIISNFVTTTLATLDISYRNWLNTGYCGIFDVSLAGTSQFGIQPPVFDYNLADNYKETIHFGSYGVFLALIDTLGKVDLISLEDRKSVV